MSLTSSGRPQDIHLFVMNQLPERLRPLVALLIDQDPMQMRVLAKFTDTRGRVYETPLEPGMVLGMQLDVRLPDAFLARLCLEVVA